MPNNQITPNTMMKMNIGTLLIAVLFAFNVTLSGAGGDASLESIDHAPTADDRIYEMRTYTTHPGKLDDLHDRFADHTLHLFERHGMVNVGYWVPIDQDNTLIFILAHDSEEAAESSWDAFRNDPEWQEAYEASHADGPLVSNVESVFMTATPYSDIR